MNVGEIILIKILTEQVHNMNNYSAFLIDITIAMDIVLEFEIIIYLKLFLKLFNDRSSQICVILV